MANISRGDCNRKESTGTLSLSTVNVGSIALATIAGAGGFEMVARTVSDALGCLGGARVRQFTCEIGGGAKVSKSYEGKGSAKSSFIAARGYQETAVKHCCYAVQKSV